MTDDTDSQYQRHSVDGLFTAVEYGDQTALQALKDFLYHQTDKRNASVIVERHPRHGWRVRAIRRSPG
jgi:hypothetical protein